MTEGDLKFLQRRRRMAGSWKTAGILSLVVLAGVLVWLFLKTPALVNPVFVVSQLEAGRLGRGTVELMAAILPLAILGCFLTTTVMIGFGFTVFAIERRYLGIIEGLTRTMPSVTGEGHHEGQSSNRCGVQPKNWEP